MRGKSFIIKIYNRQLGSFPHLLITPNLKCKARFGIFARMVLVLAAKRGRSVKSLCVRCTVAIAAGKMMSSEQNPEVCDSTTGRIEGNEDAQGTEAGKQKILIT